MLISCERDRMQALSSKVSCTPLMRLLASDPRSLLRAGFFLYFFYLFSCLIFFLFVHFLHNNFVVRLCC